MLNFTSVLDEQRKNESLPSFKMSSSTTRKKESPAAYNFNSTRKSTKAKNSTKFRHHSSTRNRPNAPPIPSEISMEQKSTPKMGSMKKARIFIIFFLVLLVFLSFGTEMTMRSSIVETLKIKQETEGGNQEHVIKGERFLSIKERLIQISGQYLMETPDTPQFRALDWIANRDLYEIAVDDPLLIQRYVLAVFFYSTNGREWKEQKKWLSSLHECEWEDHGGVRNCDDNREVVDISLWNNLRGTIPLEIGYLSSLRTLYLSRNKLSGTIPTQFGMLLDLRYLGLQHNHLKGTVPQKELGSLTKLSHLYLHRNDLSGVVRHVEPLCGLFKEASLEHFTADCRVLVAWKDPEIICACCTTCYLP